MIAVAHFHLDVSPNVTAGLLLAANATLKQLVLPHPTAAQILHATGAGRSRAYELSSAIVGQLAGLSRTAGRPAALRPALVDTGEVSRRVLQHVMQHPGCVTHRGPQRQRYSEGFRCFLLELWDEQEGMDLPTFAKAAEVPQGTVKDWLTRTRPQSAQSVAEDAAAEESSEGEPVAMEDEAASIASTHLETILHEWQAWHGDFIAFCDHLQRQLRIPYGRTLIANILEGLGVRIPRRRQGRSPDEKALRESFETFFPGAQWTGDGSAITVVLNGQRFTFNLELMVDTASAALTGASLRDQEDSAAVTEAFDDGVQSVGARPLCVLLDLKPANHTDEVDQALGDTIGMPATKGRPQNKAHVEGSFGLFEQTAPLMEINAESPKEQARQLAKLVVQTWARTLNHKSRPARQGQSRVGQYRDAAPTAEQLAQAKAALEERCEKQKKALETLKARQNPIVQKILEQAFCRLELDDPTGNLRAAIAGYPLDAILAGIATFEGKREAKTLPKDVDARYLLGIVRNTALQQEGFLISQALMKARLEAKDLMLQGLQRERDLLLQSPQEPTERIAALLRRALDTDRHLDRLFWLQNAAEHLGAQPAANRESLWHLAYRRIHSAFRLPYAERLAAVQLIALALVPLA